jgi:hypothetical protein
MGSPARQLEILTGGTGTLFTRSKDDWSEQELEVEATQQISGYFAEIAFGDLPLYTGAAGSFPVVITGGETIVFTLDTGTDHASGTITFAPAAGSYSQAQLLALLNAAINAVIPPPGGHSQALALDAGGGVSTLTSRSRGTGGEVDITTIHATLATGLGWAVSTTNGAAFASPASNVRVIW